MPTAFAPAHLAALVLVFCRTGALLLVAPLLGHRSIPVLHRVGLALAIAAVLAPVVPPRPAPDGFGLGFAIATELLIGLAMGGIALAVVAAVQSAGELLGFQMGLGVAAAWDPAMGSEANALTRFVDAIALLVFVAVNGHHVLLQALAASFQRVPAGTLALAATEGMVVMGPRIVRAGLELAAPITAVLFVTNALLALTSRVAPQMNVFGVGAPLTVAAGLFALVETMPHLVGTLTRLVGEIGGDLTRMLAGGFRV
jgi:flagellar biosynthetic protein FliR